MNQANRTSLGLALLAALFYLPFLGGVHLFDWDEVNFAEISREMLLTGDYGRVYINFQPFWEKPPFFFWLQSSAMALFGVGEYAARFPNAICGILTLVVIYRMGRKLYNHKFGLVWALTYFGSVLPFLYFKSSIIDPWFNFFIFSGLYGFILFYWKKDGFELELKWNKWWYLFVGGFLIGMGIITKGPVAYLIAALTMGVYWVYQRFRFYVNVPQFLFFSFAATLITLSWYGIETLRNGPWFIYEFNKYQYRLFSTPDAGHSGFPGYHFVVLLAGCFPASIFAIRSFWKLPETEQRYQADFRRWMKYLFWVVLILFTIVKSKIVHYSSMCYFPLTYLAALVIYLILEGKITFNRWMRFGVWGVAGLYLLATLSLPFLAQNIALLKPLFNDPFAVANLDAKVHWTGFEIIPGLFLLALLIYSLPKFQSNSGQGFRVLFLGTGVFVMLTLIAFVKRIEGYSQRAAIEFCEQRIGEDCYVYTSGYKSYVQLFYTRKPPVTNPDSWNQDWLFNGPIDKDVYVITKIDRTEEMESLPQFKEIGRKNGFVFYKRSKEIPK
jgi:4-amino-4-deoxy-L-arabinose transferase-like glycosyltransferase